MHSCKGRVSKVHLCQGCDVKADGFERVNPGTFKSLSTSARHETHKRKVVPSETVCEIVTTPGRQSCSHSHRWCKCKAGVTTVCV